MSPVEYEFHQPCTGGKGELETMGQLTRNEVFTLAVQKYSDAVYRAAIHNSRCTADAEDVVQDVFYNVWQRRETLDDSNSLYKYLLRSVYNRSLNYLDKNRRAGEYGAYYRERIAALGSSYYAPDNSPVVQKLYNDDLRASLDAAIESLPPKCREVFRLSYIEDLSNREIGEQLGISPRTVENHMYAALKQLRRKLSKEQLLLLLSLLFMRGV